MNTDEQMEEQIETAQHYAQSIEYSLKKIFNCNQGGFGGEIEAGIIRTHPFLSMTQGLAFIYATSPHKRKNIDKFIETFTMYSDMSLDEILSFVTNEKTIDMITFQIEKDNGLEQVRYMISEFDKVIE